MADEVERDEPETVETQIHHEPMAFVVTLRTGERVVSRLGLDEVDATGRLAEVQRELASAPFVRLGEGMVLRADEVQAVELAREGELARIEVAGSDARLSPGRTGDAGDAPAGARSSWTAFPSPTPVDRARRAVAERVGLLPSAELVATVLGIAAVLLAALATEAVDAGAAWTIVAFLLAAYVLSRGISKAGTGR